MPDINLYSGEEQFRLVIGGDYWVIREPEGWDQYMLVTTRDPNKHGFITTMTNDDVVLKFSKESGKDYIDAEYALNGPDANIVLQFGLWDGVTFEEQISIRLTLEEYEKYHNYSEMGGSTSESIELFRTRLDSKADLNGNRDFNDNEIAPLDDKEIVFHSKVLQKESKITKSITETASESVANNNPVSFFTVLNLSKNFYGLLGLDFVEPSELTDVYTGATGVTQSDFLRKSLFQYKAKERGEHLIDIDITISATIKYTISATPELLDDVFYDKSDCLLKIELILRIGTSEEVIYETFTTDCGDDELIITDQHIVESRTKFINQNEEVQLYLKYTYVQTLSSFVNIKSVNVLLESYLTVNQGSFLKFTAITETRYTSGGVAMIYEAFQKCLQIVTGKKYPLISNFLGRTDIGYVNNGCGSKYSLTNGKKIRSLPLEESHLKFSGNEFFNSLDAIFCCGMGIELSEGKFYFTGEISDNKLTTQFLIPEYDSGELIFYVDGEESPIGNVTEVSILSGSGTSDDPYVYSWSNTIDDYPAQLFAVVVSSMVGKEIVRFEKREYFYRDIELFTIPASRINKKSYRETCNSDIIFNEVHIGYKKYPENELNTLDEFNTKHEYLLPFKTQKRKLEKFCDFITSGYAIEFQRRSQFSDEKTGKSAVAYDDDIFLIALSNEEYQIPAFYFIDNQIFLNQRIINPPAIPFTIEIMALPGGTTSNAGIYTVNSIEDIGFLPYTSLLTIDETLTTEIPVLTVVKYTAGDYTPERAQPFDIVNNIIGPNSAYNLRLSPKRMLMNWARWFNSGLFHKSGSQVVINTFTKNNIISGGLETQFNEAETCNLGDDTKALIVENNNESLSNLNSNQKLLKPFRIKLSARLTWSEVQYIRDRLKKGYLSNAYGYIKFEDLDGVQKKGFIESLKFNPKIEEVEFTLLEKA